MMEITIRVPDELGKRLELVQERLPELLERALAEEIRDNTGIVADEEEIIETLTGNPSPRQVLDLRASDTLQARMSELLERSKQEELSRAEEIEMERYLTLEHLVRLAKAHAYQQLAKAE
ncbi:MAG: hypothetical protein IT331_04600 [Anaerolineae bacterium]|nr:hypothetical protein [Anaerolineae bacterium]